MRSGNVVEKIYRSAIRARSEVHFETKFRVINHHRLGPRDGSRKYVVASIGERVLLIVDNRSDVIENLPVQISAEFDDLSTSLKSPPSPSAFWL
jgi:hypothetical protein